MRRKATSRRSRKHRGSGVIESPSAGETGDYVLYVRDPSGTLPYRQIPAIGSRMLMHVSSTYFQIAVAQGEGQVREENGSHRAQHVPVSRKTPSSTPHCSPCISFPRKVTDSTTHNTLTDVTDVSSVF